METEDLITFHEKALQDMQQATLIFKPIILAVFEDDNWNGLMPSEDRYFDKLCEVHGKNVMNYAFCEELIFNYWRSYMQAEYISEELTDIGINILDAHADAHTVLMKHFSETDRRFKEWVDLIRAETALRHRAYKVFNEEPKSCNNKR